MKFTFEQIKDILIVSKSSDSHYDFEDARSINDIEGCTLQGNHDLNDLQTILEQQHKIERLHDIIDKFKLQIPQWVCVKERLPKPHDSVVFYAKGHQVNGWVNDNGEILKAAVTGIGIIEGATHWTLPMAPPEGIQE